MMASSVQIRTYERSQSVVFFKTKEAFGGLSNMASGYPLRVNGIRILTSEALYQACRFPHLPEVQRQIIAEQSPMTAKMKSKPYRSQSREDWDTVRTQIMRWCLRVKLAQNWKTFGDLLLATGDRPIVEESRKDDFWGAKQRDDGILVGINVLGRLLMELRMELRSNQRDDLRVVRPLPIRDFLLYERPIQPVTADGMVEKSATVLPPSAPLTINDTSGFGDQTSFFDAAIHYGSPNSSIIGNEEDAGIFGALKRYPLYKPSGHPWIDEVPERWSVLPNRAIFSEVNERDHPSAEMLSVTITRGVIPQRTLISGGSKKDGSKIDKSAYKFVSPGDITYNKMRAWQGAIGASRFKGIVSPAYVVMRLRERQNQPGYFHYLYRTPQFAKEAERWSYGITSDMWSLRPEHFKMIYSPIPPPGEQAAIVRFLDHATRRIDRTIHAKRRVIALLDEQKQAIIHQVISRGVNLKSPLKSSGTPWLGQVPEQWQVLQLRRLVSLVTSGSRGWANYYSDSGYIFLQSGNLSRSMALDLSFIQHVKPPGGSEGERTRVQRGDILICITGALTGNVAIVDMELPMPAFVNQHVALVRPKTRLVIPRYLAVVLHSEIGRTQFKASEYGGTKQGLGLGDVKSAIVPLPSKEEQEKICDVIDRELAGLSRTISTTEKEISLLREYGTRLIADVVTGKLDVREAARQLPNDVGERDEPIQANEGEETEIKEAVFAGAADG